MRILISNDDGIYSPGIVAAARAASKFGDVRIVAPDVEQSSMGHAITHGRPLRYHKTRLPDGFDAYRVNGTPADCVALGAHRWEKVDLVLSGVNLGLNLGNSMWHSGTLAAARQAALLNIRAVALSAPVSKDEPDFSKLQPFIEQAIEQLLPEKDLCLVNVNFPEFPKGVRWTRQSVRHYDGKVADMHDPLGRPVYWITVTALEPADEGTDRWAVENGYVSMTPLRLDLTDQTALAKVLARRSGEVATAQP